MNKREETLGNIALVLAKEGVLVGVEVLEQLLAVASSPTIEALAPFARFFKGPDHDLSPAKDHVIAASFLDDNKQPLAELYIADFRRASEVFRELSNG